MPGARFNKLIDVAADQFGFVTQQDAAALGLPPDALPDMARRGQIQHMATGVYRLGVIPATQFDSYMQAALWPRRARGVLSHGTALEIYELSDVNPAKIHITVPRDHRPRRAIPRQYVLHREDLAAREIARHEGLPVVTPAKAMQQIHASHLGRRLVQQALDEAIERGLIPHRERDRLREELAAAPKSRT